MLMVLALALINSCSSPQGLSVFKTKTDLGVRGVSNIKGFTPGSQVLMSDTLYTKGPPNEDMVQEIKPNKKGEYIMPDVTNAAQLPKYLYQLKNGLFNKEDYLWAIGITPDFKIQTIILDDKGNPGIGGSDASNGGGAVPGEASNKTFDIFGAEIKAVKIDDGTIAYYEPYRLSFMLNEAAVATKLVQFSYNNQDMQIVDLNDQAMAKAVSRKVKVVTVDLKYGNRFTFLTADGKYPNISPELIKEGRVTLEGLQLSKNEVGVVPYFLLEVPRGDYSAQRSGSENRANNDKRTTSSCGGYYDMKLKPARTAKDENYPNGYIKLDCCSLCQNHPFTFARLVATGAIGYDKSTGRNQSTTRIDPEQLKNLDKALYEQSKDKIVKTN